MTGRFAPSPTGAMHLGNARTALLAWLAVRSAGAGSGARIVMRIEDLDHARVVPGAEERLLDEMRWLGLDWDGEVVRQSERAERYDAAAARLVAAGLAYDCACSRAEIAGASSAPHQREEGPRYPGTCATLAPGEAAARAKALRRDGVALRFRGGGERIAFRDEVHGEVEPLGDAGVDDFVIRRVDGVAAYQLAVVVDDAAMGVDHVLRADDLLISTPRQIALHRALGSTPPAFAHVPLVLAPGGERLAKRNRPIAIGDLRARGVTAETIVGALAHSAGLTADGTPSTATALIESWGFARLHRAAVTIDPDSIR